MSYNTRHTRQTGGQGIGVGRGSSQVMYHQQQQRPGGGGGGANQQRVQQNQPSQNTQQSHGYSQQPIQTVSGGNFPSQQSGPGYGSSQNQQPAAASATQSYSSNQYQTQQQASPPQQQPVNKLEPASPKPSTPNAATTGGTEAPTTKMEVEGDEAAEGAGETRQKPWIKKRLPGFKVNKKIKRRRQNARLRKILQPKNAIMVLNELKTGIKFTFQEHTNALTQTMFVVNAEVDGKTHIGQGLSKPLAKQNAAENALKALLLEKMAEAALKAAEGADASEPMQQDSNNGHSASGDNASDGSEAGTDVVKPGAPEDDVPWGSLASFALYKLFTEWQSQGTHVPIPKQPTPVAPNQILQRPKKKSDGVKSGDLGDQNPLPVKTGAPAPMKKIPENPTERHPVMLLNQLRPGVQFSEVSREGTPPNLTFTLGVTVDGKSFTGVAKNKKDAKKEAAKAALAGALQIFYD